MIVSVALAAQVSPRNVRCRGCHSLGYCIASLAACCAIILPTDGRRSGTRFAPERNHAWRPARALVPSGSRGRLPPRLPGTLRSNSCTHAKQSNWLPLSPSTARPWCAARSGSPAAACSSTGPNRNAGWTVGSTASRRLRPTRRQAVRRLPRPVAPRARRAGRDSHQRNAHSRVDGRALRRRSAAGHNGSRTDRAEHA